MKNFKLKKGISTVYPITNEKDFYDLTGGRRPYMETGKDGKKRAFGICPGCDNPIQIVGLYYPVKNTDKPYGKHYNRDAPIAKHNENAYRFCPYAENTYTITEYRNKEITTEFEAGIYYTLRKNFDLAVFLMEKVSGLYISDKLAKEILKSYVNAAGYLYYGSTYYNLPWMLLYVYTMPAKNCFGLIVKKDSLLYDMFSGIKDICLEPLDRKPGYYRVKGNECFIDYQLSFGSHERKIVNDEVEETLKVDITTEKGCTGNEVYKIVNENTLSINERRFPSLINSEKAQTYRDIPRNQRLRKMAQEIMPDLPDFPDTTT